MNDTVNVEEATEAATEVENQATTEASKSFSQEQLDKIVEDRLAKQRRALENKYKGVDVDHYRQLTEEQEQKKLEAQKARGEFENVLKETVSKKDSAIEQLRNELTSVKVDGALLSAANRSGAINADQVVSLLKGQIRLGEGGILYGRCGEGAAVWDVKVKWQTKLSTEKAESCVRMSHTQAKKKPKKGSQR